VSKVSQKVLILGGTGRIGSSVARDLIAHTSAQVIITGRQIELGKKCADTLGEKVSFLPLDLADIAGLARAISTSNLVIHCAGPFHHRDANVLKTCIDLGVNYLDVSDHRSFTHKNLAYKAQAEQAGITAILNTGVFPGISNSMVRQAVEKLDTPEAIHLSYVVSGSGGAGLTIMKTTFLGLVNEFEAIQPKRNY
jgi:saccharopine dehydrogenase-like NADP-dependent oxidoreductase